MLATMEIVDLLDSSETIGHMVMNSDTMHHYNEAKYALENDRDAQALIKRFADIKEHYEDVQRFGRYHPDYNDIMKKVRSVKRNGHARNRGSFQKKRSRKCKSCWMKLAKTWL